MKFLMAFGTMVGGTVGQPITTGYCPGAVVGKFVRTAASKHQKVHHKSRDRTMQVYFESERAKLVPLCLGA